MLQEKFRNYVRERSLCTADERILLAVSGGVDSMVMLSLFALGGYRIGVAHCNFQLRGKEADEDDVLVEQQAARYGAPYFGIRFDTLAEVAATGDSVEMAARRLRYGWFDIRHNRNAVNRFIFSAPSIFLLCPHHSTSLLILQEDGIFHCPGSTSRIYFSAVIDKH